jgi:uncharacterized membrane protein
LSTAKADFTIGRQAVARMELVVVGQVGPGGTMSAGRVVATYFGMTVVFFAIDMLWLGVVARGFYQRHLGGLLAERVNWAAAVVFYLMYLGGILLFAVLPALERGSLGRAALLGFLFGLVAYATYDLTNLATLKGFPAVVAIVDLAWGGVLTTAVATSGFALARHLSQG